MAIWSRFRARDIFTLVLLAAFAYGTISAAQWRAGPRAFPLLICPLGFGLVLIQLLIDLSGRTRSAGSSGDDQQQMTSDLSIIFTADKSTVLRRGLMFGVALLGFTGLIWLLGFFIAVPVFVLVFLRLAARLSWLRCLVSATAMFLFMVGVFDTFLGIRWPTPIIGGPDQVLQEFTRDMMESIMR